MLRRFWSEARKKAYQIECVEVLICERHIYQLERDELEKNLVAISEQLSNAEPRMWVLHTQHPNSQEYEDIKKHKASLENKKLFAERGFNKVSQIVSFIDREIEQECEALALTRESMMESLSDVLALLSIEMSDVSDSEYMVVQNDLSRLNGKSMLERSALIRYRIEMQEVSGRLHREAVRYQMQLSCFLQKNDALKKEYEKKILDEERLYIEQKIFIRNRMIEVEQQIFEIKRSLNPKVVYLPVINPDKNISHVACKQEVKVPRHVLMSDLKGILERYRRDLSVVTETYDNVIEGIENEAQFNLNGLKLQIQWLKKTIKTIKSNSLAEKQTYQHHLIQEADRFISQHQKKHKEIPIPNPKEQPCVETGAPITETHPLSSEVLAQDVRFVLRSKLKL